MEGEKISQETWKQILNEFVLLYTNTPEPQLKIPYLYKVPFRTCNKASFITQWSPLYHEDVWETRIVEVQDFWG